MTILLYDYYDLEEKSNKNLSIWKACHLILYACAAICGIANYVFLQNTMQLVNDNCPLYPRELEFHTVELTQIVETQVFNVHEFNQTEVAQGNATVPSSENEKVKRETIDNGTESETPTIVVENGTIFTENKTHRIALDTSRTLFEMNGSDCQFAEYMPLMSTIFAAVWITMFTMCPRGGRVRAGLPQPWRILTPALLFALVMVGLTAHNFSLTDGGLQAFCEGFYDLTTSTTCSSVDPFLELGWNSTWGFGDRVAATRATCAGVLACWACAAALLIARCLAAPDFVLRRTDVYLAKDPQQKVIPHLLKSENYHQRSSQSSPHKRDNVSMRSEPTVTTELVTASVEQDSVPSSLISTPLKTPRHTATDDIEMVPQERLKNQ